VKTDKVSRPHRLMVTKLEGKSFLEDLGVTTHVSLKHN